MLVELASDNGVPCKRNTTLQSAESPLKTRIAGKLQQALLAEALFSSRHTSLTRGVVMLSLWVRMLCFLASSV